jgi:hypothetical protein
MTLPVRPFRFMPCPACCIVCEACKDQQYPAELTVTFAGVANGGGCNDCGNANGAWVLQADGSCMTADWNGVIQSVQNYQGAFPSVNMCQCAYQQATLEIFLQIGWNYGGVAGQRAIAVAIGNNLGCLSVQFLLLEQNQTEPFDCLALTSVLLPYVDAGLYCGSPAATCEVSA